MQILLYNVLYGMSGCLEAGSDSFIHRSATAAADPTSTFCCHNKKLLPVIAIKYLIYQNVMFTLILDVKWMLLTEGAVLLFYGCDINSGEANFTTLCTRHLSAVTVLFL